MNYIDLAIALMLLLGAIHGYRKGLIAEAASLAALVFGIWGAIEFSHIASDYLTKHFQVQWNHLDLWSFIITFLVIVILIYMLGDALNRLIKVVALGFVNRLAGFFFGVLKSALILCVVIIILDPVDEDVHLLPPTMKEESRVYVPMKNFIPGLMPFIPVERINR